jgi:hypothetical protein
MRIAGATNLTVCVLLAASGATAGNIEAAFGWATAAVLQAALMLSHERRA